MKPTICPTITADTPAEYKRQMEVAEEFATRIHVDASDGQFSSRKLISFDNVWWRGNRTIDLHIMYRRPAEHADIILALSPRLVIIHAESEGNFLSFAELLKKHGIEVGIALLPSTAVDTIAPALDIIDHALVFSGRLGYQGGATAELDLLKKATQLRTLKPTIEIGWDGGVNDENIGAIAAAGVDVINVGSFIQHAVDPVSAYAKLQALL